MTGAGRSFILDMAAYLGSAADIVLRRPVLVPAMLLFAALTASTAAALFAASAARYGLVLIAWGFAAPYLAVTILRLATRSDRPAWAPDRGFWLYLLLHLLLGLLPALVSGLAAGDNAMLFANLGRVIVSAFFAPWLVAIAVGGFDAWGPGGWLRGFRHWFPHQLLWILLLVLPLLMLQQWMSSGLVEGADWFWPMLVAYAGLGFLATMIGLALALASHRRVARD